jgi:glycosyltransferase involved in cell wall biosynthesis
MKKTRILHLPTTVGIHSATFSRLERELGFDSWSLTLEQNGYRFPCDEVLWAEGDSAVRREIKRWKLLARAIKNYDLLHFNFGSTLMPKRVDYIRWVERGLNPQIYPLYQYYAKKFEMFDLILLKRMKKSIVMTFQGDDARQGDFSQSFKYSIAREVEEGYYSTSTDNYKRQRIKLIDQYVDTIYAVNPDLMWVLPSRTKFLPYCHVDLENIKPHIRPAPKRPMILHAPTHRRLKGTQYILDALQRLKSEGVDFELRLIEGLTHEELQKQYIEADLLIDQVIGGWYGGLALELMAMGKPVVCYIRENDMRFIPPQMRLDLPIIEANVDNLDEVLRNWLTHRREELPDRGLQSRLYAERWHHPKTVIQSVVSDYHDALLKNKR